MKMRFIHWIAIISFIAPFFGYNHSDFRQSTKAINTTITVSTFIDVIDSGDGLCSLREAVVAANTNSPSGAQAGECPAGSPGADVIELPPGVYTLTIAGEDEGNAQTGDLDIVGDLEITTTSGLAVIDAQQLDRIFDIKGITHVTLRNLKLINGSVTGTDPGEMAGGAVKQNAALGSLQIYNSVFENNESVDDPAFGLGGGAIFAIGALTVEESTFTNNRAVYGGGAINAYNSENLSSVKRSLFRGNFASRGGAIYNSHNLSIQNSTFSMNSAVFGGALMGYERILGISFSTIVYNQASTSGAGIYSTHLPTITLEANILSGNVLSNTTTLANCQLGVALQPGQHNYEDASTCSFNGSPNHNSVSIMLGPLADWGGPTMTHPLIQGSPLIDGAPSVYCPTVDQRNYPRPLDGDGDALAVCDPGAFELDDKTEVQMIYLPLILR